MFYSEEKHKQKKRHQSDVCFKCGGKIHFLLPYETITEENLTPKTKLIFFLCVEVGGGVLGPVLNAGDLFAKNKCFKKIDKT